MKAFEKLWESFTGESFVSDFWEKDLSPREFVFAAAKTVWRKSLEQVLKQMENNPCMANGELKTWIEKEIEE